MDPSLRHQGLEKEEQSEEASWRKRRKAEEGLDGGTMLEVGVRDSPAEGHLQANGACQSYACTATCLWPVRPETHSV